MGVRKPPWFGRLLDWLWDPQGERHVAWHSDRPHYLVKVNRRTADAQGGGMQPGWHIWDDNPTREATRWNGFGPGVGRTVAAAKRNAEAWIICPYEDMMGYPKLNLAMYSTGVHYEGLAIVRDDKLRLFVVRRDDATRTAVGSITPVFHGRGGNVTVEWSMYVLAAHSTSGLDTILDGYDRWAEAVRAFHKEVTP